MEELDKLLVIKKKFVLMLPCLLHKQLVHLSTCLLVNHITMSTSQATCSLVYLSTCQPYYHVYFTSNLFTCLLVYLSTILPCLLHKQLVHLSTCLLVNLSTILPCLLHKQLVYLSTCQPYYHVYFTSNSFTCLPEKKFENSIYILTLTKGGRLS